MVSKARIAIRCDPVKGERPLSASNYIGSLYGLSVTRVDN
jgi:hypothetical protein